MPRATLTFGAGLSAVTFACEVDVRRSSRRTALRIRFDGSNADGLYMRLSSAFREGERGEAVMGGETFPAVITEMERAEDAIRRGGAEVTIWVARIAAERERECTAAPDFKVTTAWANAPAFKTEWTPVGAITLNVGALQPGTTVILRAPGGDPINLTPQAAALRAALPTIDALPWPAADKHTLRDAAHAVCEIVEATDGKAPAALRGPVTEMLAALATSAHVGPAVIGEAVKARDAARAAMPRRK